MGLRLEIISQHRLGLGKISSKEFGRAGGTIGRSLSNDWALPDAQRYLSARHACIDYRSGSYYIIDTSTNGVFVNESDKPVGRGNPQRLFTGDRVRIGDYLMIAKIDHEEDTADQLEQSDHVDPVVRAQRVESPAPVSYDLIGEHEMTGVGTPIELAESGRHVSAPKDDPFGGLSLADDDEAHVRTNPAPAARPPSEHTAPIDPPQSQQTAEAEPVAPIRPGPPAGRSGRRMPPRTGSQRPAGAPDASPSMSQRVPKMVPQRVSKSVSESVSQRAAPNVSERAAPSVAPKISEAASHRASQTGSEKRLQQHGAQHAAPDGRLDAFFRGAGIDARHLNEQQANAALYLIGQLLRELLAGLAETLHARSQQKRTLRLANTTIQRSGNNPLKFSAGTDEAINNLLFRESKEYLPALEAVRDAFADIDMHQNALFSALRAAVPSFVGRFDPAALESKLSRRSTSGSMMNTTSRLRYWELYKDLYQTLSHHEPGELPIQFLDDLVRAYEALADGHEGAPSNVNDSGAG